MRFPDPWIWSQLQDLLEKLRQNLPLTIATTVVMSLVVSFWKKLLELAKRSLGLEEPKEEEIRPGLPEGDVTRFYSLEKFRGGFKVPWGWRGAAIDAGVIQRELGPGRYRRRAVAKMSSRMALGENARIVLWRDREFPIVLSIGGLFASDHQPMMLEIAAVVRIHPARLLQSSMEELTRPPERIAGQIAEKLRLPAQEWMSGIEGIEPYRHRQKQAEWGAMAETWMRPALEGSAFDLIRVTGFRAYSPALDRLYQDRGELALQGESVVVEIERNKVRGALQQAVLAGKIEEMRDLVRFEDAVRIIERERALKEKTFRQELVQEELNDLEAKVRLWQRKRDILLQSLGPVASGLQTTTELAEHVTRTLRQTAVEAPDSPFSAHEREQIRAILQSGRSRAARPDEILAAVAGGTDIHGAIFDPLAKVRGLQTLRVGDGWRIFDGEALWQVRLVRIVTRRHGFLWRRESPSAAHFEIRGSPENRRSDQEARLARDFRLTVGPHEIPMEFVGGSPSRISIRVAKQASGIAATS